MPTVRRALSQAVQELAKHPPLVPIDLDTVQARHFCTTGPIAGGHCELQDTKAVQSAGGETMPLDKKSTTGRSRLMHVRGTC